MVSPNVIVIAGYGINCERETQFAFEKAGAQADVMHINDIIQAPARLGDYQILVFPGGFSYGDDTGSGRAFANRVRNHLGDAVREFVERGKLVIGICNGFQILTNLGLVPAFNREGVPEVALVHNDGARYIDRWVDVAFSGHSPWTRNVGTISLPIAHGEGKLHADEQFLQRMRAGNLIAGRYVEGEICRHQSLQANPNGSLDDIAALSDLSGHVLGMMPHPERAIDFTHLPHWTYLREHYQRGSKPIPEEGPGLQIFRNGVSYFE